MQNVAAAGLTPAMQFANSPNWISAVIRSALRSTATAQIGAWQRFLTNFVHRYGPEGSFWAAHPNLPYHPVTSYEIWNEPNLR